MKLPFKILRCQTKGCKEKATRTVTDARAWFCDYHYRYYIISFGIEEKRLKEKEKEFFSQ